MILELDVGNTRLKWRWLNGASAVSGGALNRRDFTCAHEMVEAIPLVDVDEVFVKGIRIGSVASEEFNRELSAALHVTFSCRPCFAEVTEEASGVQVGYHEPKKLGVDRWLAVLAASRLPGGSWLVVDCGSAITVDVLSSGRHQGGYIAPGFSLMSHSLLAGTARIEDVEYSGQNVSPALATGDAVGRGVSLMAAGLVQQALVQCGVQDCGVVLTGGDARRLLPLINWGKVELQEDLVLDGLAFAQCVPLGDAV